MSATTNGGTIQGKVTRDVETPADYKEAKRHAEALGLSVSSVEAFGDWETHDGHAVFLRDGVEIESVGRKYFHIAVDGRTEKIQATNAVRGPGKLRVTFKN